VEGNKLPTAVHHFPQQVVERSVIRQMAVYTLRASVRPCVKPSLETAFHHVAAAAKLRASRPGVEFRRAKGQKGPQSTRYYPDGHEDEPEFPALNKFQHNETHMKVLNTRGL
jgi:hypothetical protein